MNKLLGAAFAVCAACWVSSAEAVTINVAGTSNPFLAGMPNGSTSGSDTAPDESPALVTGLSFTGGDILQFSATGTMRRGPGNDFVGPDGNQTTLGAGSNTASPANGISNYVMPQSALLGVFLTDDQPDLTPAPAPLPNFAINVGGIATVTYAQDFTVLNPGLKQIFFIGDGLDLSSNVQSFVVPDGATRLFLGTSDLFGWFNNEGGFDVTVTNTPGTPPPDVVPLPAGALLLLTGLGMLAVRRRQS